MRTFAYLALFGFVVAMGLQDTFMEALYGYVGSVPKLVGIGAFVVGAAATLYSGKLRKLTRLHIFIFMFIGWAAMSFVWSGSVVDSQARAITYIQMAIMVWLIAQFAIEEHEQRGLMCAYLIGGMIMVIAMLQNMSTGNLVVGQIGGAGVQRVQAFETNPNEVALGLAIGVPMAWYLFLNSRFLLKWFGLICVLGSAIGIFLTGSRGGVLALIVGLGIIPLTFHRVSHVNKLVIIGSLVLGGLATVSLVPQQTWNRFLGDRSEASFVSMLNNQQQFSDASLEDTDIRIRVWQKGLLTFLDNPAVGVGAGAFSRVVEPTEGQRLVAHSVWVSVLVELGAIGMFLFLLVVGKAAWSTRLMEVNERMVWLFVMATWALGVAFISWEHSKTTWLIFSMIAARMIMLEPIAKAKRRRQVRQRAARLAPHAQHAYAFRSQ